MKKSFVIKLEEADQRLDKFIAQNWPEYSRTYLQKQIKTGTVLINGKIKKPSYIIKAGDEIEAEILPTPEISLEPDPTIKLNIIYEDDDVIVVDKPAGLTVHPSATQKSGTLINGLLTYYPPLKEVGEDRLRPGLVHRLDKDTSGLIIVAKNNFAFNWLKKQFQQRKVIKKYLALVIGHPKQLHGEIKIPIARSKSIPTKQKVALTGKEAVTIYRVIKKFHDFSLVEIQPKTGRMHQIRVHLAWLGNPVAGDKKYGQKGKPILSLLTRQFLHAFYLKIKLPNGQEKIFKAPLPDDLKNILTTLEEK